MKIVADDKIPFLKGVLEPWAEMIHLPGAEISASDLKDADALITRTRTVCDASLLEGSAVRIIASATIGYDHIDTAFCDSHGIEWTNAPGCNSSSVAQYAASVLCTLAAGHSLELRGMTLGVVGVGNVGSKVARMAESLGMNVLLCDPPRARREGPEGFVGMEEIVRHSDIVTLHVPLNVSGEDSTWHMVDADMLAMMNPSQMLINASRGPVVHGSALSAALRQGRLTAAALDVWEDEAAVDGDLLGRVEIATPHIAGYSADGKAGGTAAAVNAVASALGIPLRGWTVPQLPAPPQALHFTVDGKGKSIQQTVSEAILHSYDVMKDDAALRGNPCAFERIRGNYQVRREFPAFTVTLRDCDEKAGDVLGALGFNCMQL